MNFHEFLLLEAFTREDLRALATRIFGHCDEWYDYDDDDDYELTCRFKNRKIEFVYYPEERLIEVSFFFADDPTGGVSPDVFTTGRELQSGTMEGIRKFEEFASELRKRGIGVKYETEGMRREDLYKRVMRKAGMTLAGSRGGYWTWR